VPNYFLQRVIADCDKIPGGIKIAKSGWNHARKEAMPQTRQWGGSLISGFEERVERREKTTTGKDTLWAVPSGLLSHPSGILFVCESSFEHTVPPLQGPWGLTPLKMQSLVRRATFVSSTATFTHQKFKKVANNLLPLHFIKETSAIGYF
jgi:hypothetical protein